MPPAPVMGYSLRKVAFSEDGGATWSDPVSDPVLIEPIYQASLLMVPGSHDTLYAPSL